jgi:Ca2+-binding EF-hand superfamily protein
MNSMNKLALGSIAASVLLMSNAMAQSKSDHLFSQIDTDKDGKISASEHAAQAKARFDKMDKNKTGKFVIADEFQQPNKPSRGQATAEADIAVGMLKAMDTDGDGVITAEEHAKAAAARFEKMDTNKDGVLSKEEWKAGRAAMMERPTM